MVSVDVPVRPRAFESALRRVHASIALLESAPASALDLRPVGSALEELFGSLCDWADRRAAPDRALERAREAALAARRILAPGGEDVHLAIVRELDGVGAELAELEATPIDAPPASSDAREDALVVSGVRPALKRCRRMRSLRPTLRVGKPAAPEARILPSELPAPTTFEALESHGERLRAHLARYLEARTEGVAPHPVSTPPAVSREMEFLRRWARECVDEVAMVALQREPLLGDDWRSCAALEERMLRAIDAFASLGEPALAWLEPLHFDAPAPDPSRVFAVVLLAASFEGRDALGLVERFLHAVVTDRAALLAAGDALVLAPHPELDARLRAYLVDVEPSLRELAVRTLARRGGLADHELRRCADDRPEIASHALVPLALRRHPEHLRLIEEALGSSRSELRCAAARALALASPARAQITLRGWLGGADGDEAAMLLAMLGAEVDVPRLVDHARRAPTPRALAALGVAGRVFAIEALLAFLRDGDEALALEAARALERLLGARLLASVAIAPEELPAPPELPEPEVPGPRAPSLAREVSDPRDVPALGSPDTLELPSPEFEVWRAYWLEHRGRFEASRRHRAGAPHAALGVWQELAGGALRHDERRDAGFELQLLTRTEVGLDVRALVGEQLAALERLRPVAARVAAREE